MNYFRNLTKNIFFKILMSILGISFVFFGVGDLLFTNSNWVAKIEREKISHKDFANRYNNISARMMQLGISDSSYLESKDFQMKVLKAMILNRLKNRFFESIGIKLDNEYIIKQIVKDKNFYKDRKFNKTIFNNFLSSNNISEQEYIKELSNKIKNDIFFESIEIPDVINSKILNDIYLYNTQERVVDVLTLSPSTISFNKIPSEFELIDFFEANKDKFVIEETREVEYISFSLEDIKKSIEIPLEEIISEYKLSNEFKIPETRDFYNVLFDKKEDAEKFLKILGKNNIKSQEKFLKLVNKELKKEEKDILIEKVHKEYLFQDISSKVFSLKTKEYSKVLPTSMGFHIFYLKNINPGRKLSLEEAKEQIISKKQNDLIPSKIEQVRDNLLENNSFDYVKDITNIKRETTVLIKNQKHKIELDNFNYKAFSSEVSEVSDLFFSETNGKYYALVVKNSTPRKERSLDEVKSMVIELWNKEKITEILNQSSKEIIKSINESIDIDKLRKKYNLSIDKSIYLSQDSKKFNSNFIRNIFLTPINKATKTFDKDLNEVKIAIVKKIIRKKNIDENYIKTIKNAYNNKYKYNIEEKLQQSLEDKFKIKINSKLIN